MDKPIVIIGAGIAGLTLGVMLKRLNLDFVIFEKAKELKKIGSGLMLSINSVNCLKKLGLEEELYAAAFKINKVYIRTDQGKLICVVDYSEYCQKYNISTVCITRSDLHAVLAKNIHSSQLRLGQTFTHFIIQEDGNVLAHFDSGETLSGSMLAGADGIHSSVFKQLIGDESLRYGGSTSFRGLVNVPYEENESHLYGEYWGCGKRFGILRANANQLYWFATFKVDEHQTINVSQVNEFVATKFQNWASPIEELIAKTKPENIIQADIYDRPPHQKWYEGPVVLLGDAIHPTTPNLGQGAGMAIESAIVLANCYRQMRNAGFKNYFDNRYPRTSWITNLSWKLGRLSLIDNRLLCQLRNFIFAIYPERLEKKQYEKLFSYDPFKVCQ